jgi:hypothetical protein
MAAVRSHTQPYLRGFKLNFVGFHQVSLVKLAYLSTKRFCKVKWPEIVNDDVAIIAKRSNSIGCQVLAQATPVKHINHRHG